MALLILPCVLSYRVKSNVYTYYRREGRRVCLPNPAEPGFHSAYAAAHAAAEAARTTTTGASTMVPGSMAALISAYRASPEWRRYDKAFRPLEERFGRLAVATMPRQFVFKLRDEYATQPATRRNGEPILDREGKQVIRATPRRANRMVNVLRLLLAWAVNRGGLVKENVALRPGKLEIGPGYRVWTAADVATLLASADEPIRRAVVLGVCTGQRKGDCLTMLWSSRADGVIEVTQEKTGIRLRIPEHPDLTRALNAAPTTAETILTRPDGKPWRENHFNAEFAKAVRQAKPSCPG